MTESSEVNNGANPEEIRRLVETYWTEELNPKLPKFSVDGPFSPQAVLEGGMYANAGCYVIYSENGFVRYIGMSLSRVGNRIRAHLSPKRQQSQFWLEGPAHSIDLIEVTDPWQAPSLEEYLIEKAYPESRGYRPKAKPSPATNP